LGWGSSNQYKGKANLAASNDDAVVLWLGMEGCQMTKDFYFNTAEAMDKAKADRGKPVTPVEYKFAISDAGADSNMLWPDTPFVPKGTGKITLLESKPNTWVMRITADRRIEVNEDVEVTEAAQKVLDAMRCLLAALPAQRPDVDALVALARADEREACAKVADLAEPYQAADLIRARGNT
jgi:hypothetical protein